MSLVVTHGNGPQIGQILLRQEAAAPEVPPMPMDVCGAESQGQLGYLIAQALDSTLLRRGVSARACPLVTQVIVDRYDPAFDRPTKPVGPWYDEQTARRLPAGHPVVRVEPGRWRRVVPSPRPLGFVAAEAMKLVAASGNVLVAAGGGGVPVVDEDGAYRGVEAVVDKDRTAAQLATLVSADQLVILTSVRRVQVGYGTAEARELDRLTVTGARDLLAAGEFPEGSMGPKIEACADFVAAGGKRAVIAALEDAADAVFGEAGTVVAD